MLKKQAYDALVCRCGEGWPGLNSAFCPRVKGIIYEFDPSFSDNFVMDGGGGAFGQGRGNNKVIDGDNGEVIDDGGGGCYSQGSGNDSHWWLSQGGWQG